MALGDELIRTDNSTPPIDSTEATKVEGAGLQPLTDDLRNEVKVRTLGDSMNQEAPTVDVQIEGSPERTPSSATDTTAVSDEGQAAQQAQSQTPVADEVVNNREEVPEDNAKTPAGVPSPEEGKKLGDSIKKVFEALENPGAQAALQQAGLNITSAQGGGASGGGAQASGGGGGQAAAQAQGGTPQAQKVPTAGEIELSKKIAQAVPEQLSGVSEQQAQQAQAAAQASGGASGGGGGSGAGGILALLQDRDVLRGLNALGASIDPRGKGPLGNFTDQFLSGQAQEEFRQRLEQGQSAGEAASMTSGLTPQGRQSVLSQFRSEQARETEEEIAREEVETAKERVEVQREELEQDARFTEEELGLQRGRLNLARREQAVAEMQSKIDQNLAEAERKLTQARANLTEERAKELRREDSQEGRDYREQLSTAVEVGKQAGAAQERAQKQLQRKRTAIQTLKGQLEDEGWFSGVDSEALYQNVKNKARQAVQEGKAENLTQGFEQAIEENAGRIPEDDKARYRRLLQLEAERAGLENQLQRLSSTQQRANQLVMSAFGQGQGQGQPAQTGQGEGEGEEQSGGSGGQASIPSFDSAEEAAQAASTGQIAVGDTVRYQGNLHRLTTDENDQAQLVRVE